jgi:hypothetical protein
MIVNNPNSDYTHWSLGFFTSVEQVQNQCQIL